MAFIAKLREFVSGVNRTLEEVVERTAPLVAGQESCEFFGH